MLLIFILLTSNVFAADSLVESSTPPKITGSGSVCFAEEETGRIVVDLENYAKEKEIIQLLKEENIELNNKADNLEKINQLQMVQVDIANKTIESLNKLIDTQKKAYEEQIKESKPSLWNQILTIAGALGAGVVVGVLL